MPDPDGFERFAAPPLRPKGDPKAGRYNEKGLHVGAPSLASVRRQCLEVARRLSFERVTGDTGAERLHVPQSGAQTPPPPQLVQPFDVMQALLLGQSAAVSHATASLQNTSCVQAEPPSVVVKHAQLLSPPHVIGVPQFGKPVLQFPPAHPGLGQKFEMGGAVEPHAGMHTGSGQQVFELQIVPGGHWDWPYGQVFSDSQQTLKSTQYDFTCVIFEPVYWNAHPHPLPGLPQAWNAVCPQ